MAASDAKWYVIHTYSGYEAMVKDSLEKLIENNNLQENIFDIQIPTEETLEEKANGKKKVVERKKFPCYVFLKMIYSNNIWYLVTNTRGVTGFVGPQGRPLPLTEEEVVRMADQGRDDDRLYGGRRRAGDERSAGILYRKGDRAQRGVPESQGGRRDVRAGDQRRAGFRSGQKNYRTELETFGETRRNKWEWR